MYGGGNNAPSRVVQPRSDAATNTRLVVTNVHYEVTVDDLKVSGSEVNIIPILIPYEGYLFACWDDHSRPHYSSKDPTLILSQRLVNWHGRVREEESAGWSGPKKRLCRVRRCPSTPFLAFPWYAPPVSLDET